MTVYLILLALIWVQYMLFGRHAVSAPNYILDEQLHRKTRRSVVVLSTLCLVLVAFRSIAVGIDTSGYAMTYILEDSGALIAQKGLFHLTEWGYVLLRAVMRRLGLGFSSITLFEGLVYLVPLGYLIYKYSRNPYLSFFIFIAFDYYLFAMTALRQTIAIGICMIAFEMAMRRKPFFFVLLVLAASTFHKTALVFLPVYVLLHIPARRKYIGLMLLGTFLIYVFRFPIRGVIRQLARIDYGNMQTGGTGMYLLMMSMCILDVFVIPGRDEPEPCGNIRNVFRNMMIAAVAMYPVLQFHPAVFRLHFYYSIMMTIYFPNVMRKIKNIWVRLGAEYAYLLVFVYYMFQYTFRQLGAVPYSFGWYW